MKKDKKFLEELEKYLSNISKTNRDRIISKYANIIKDEKAKKRKITDILKELGSPASVAEKELQSVKESFFLKMRNNVKNSNIKKNTKPKKKENNRKDNNKKVDNKEEKVEKVEPKKEIKKTEEKVEKVESKKEEVKEEKVESKKETKVEEKKKEEKKEKEAKEDKTEKKKSKLFDKLKTKKEDKPKKEKKEKVVKEKPVKEKTKLSSLFKKKKVTTDEESEALELVEKLEKKEQYKLEKKAKKSTKEKFKAVGSFLTKDITPGKKKKDVKEEPKEEVKEEPEVKEKPVKEKTEKKHTFIFKRHDKNELVEVVEPKESVSDIIEDIHDDIKEELEDVNEIVAERRIFETRGQRATRILLKTLGLIIVTLLLFVWLWVAVVFFAAIFAYLDGVKFIGLNIFLLGLLVLLLTAIVMINRGIFRKKHHVTFSLIVIVLSVLTMAFGIAYSLKQISEIETVKDVTVKYAITNKMSTHEFSDNTSKKYVLTFNSNYNTQYTIDYDDSLEGKFKMEVKYFECYYDYYIKQSSNQAYVSLKLDPRDRLSVYIDDLKEGQVFDNDELSRYSVKITINPNDVDRLVINN